MPASRTQSHVQRLHARSQVRIPHIRSLVLKLCIPQDQEQRVRPQARQRSQRRAHQQEQVQNSVWVAAKVVDVRILVV